jgi:hypothetical protein
MPAVQIPCPGCGCRRTAVVMTRQLEDAVIVRRRKCLGCDHRWYTRQPPEVAVSAYALEWAGTGTDCTITDLRDGKGV